MNFRKVNNLVGWITGAIATLVYLKTMEPTVSFWDCGEFLSCAFKVEVGHSPGAPLFMLIQRLFGILAGSNLEKVALMINAWSAIASGLTILFLFWTITHFAKKLVSADTDEPNTLNTVLIMGSGMVGALAYTFSDTFWFSAVEAEVYATSSLFTALTFWAILKWEHVANQKYADRWLIFIAYMMGLSVGIHLLNLLAIPTIGMVYYYKRYKATTSGAVIAFIVSCAILGLVQFGVLQGLPILASKFDLLFVNSLGMPFDSGAITFLVLLVAVLVWGLIYLKRKGHYLAHTGLLCLVFVIIGFSSYLAPIIRSRADVPIDMTNPDNAISLTSYLQREQFGQQPLLYGPDFTARPIGYPSKGDMYARATKDGKDVYEVVGKKVEQEFDAADKRFFPRIWDMNDGMHVNFYKNYLGLADGETPTSADNLRFFFNYQINWMWWRYFMWNYAGRQNDFEGQGDPKNGNWISGIKPIDKMYGRGDMDKMQNGFVNNPARNQLYFLPLVLGILGMVYQFNRNKKDGIVTGVLFFFTGIAIAIYLNMPPVQPRERDYAFAGSTYAFAIWIGLGVLMVYEWLQRAVKGSAGAYASIALCLLAVPALMAKEEWDDHDRSKKTFARASAYNTLTALAPNAILFTFGDNDTYPVWYMQEIEGYRKDVRVINMSLLGIDWYIDQLSYKVNDADAVPMIWKHDDYIGDRRNYIRFYQSPQIPAGRAFNLIDICKFMVSNDPNNKLRGMNPEETENFYPTKNFFLPGMTKDELYKNGLAKASDSAVIDNEVKFTFNKDVAYKDDIATLNIVAAIAQEGWKRPIYFGGGLPQENYIGMQEYLRLEGTVYRLMPYKVIQQPNGLPQDMGSIDIDKTYDLFVNKYIWGNADRNDVYFDEKNRIMFSAYRVNAGRIATELAALGRNKEGEALLDKVMKGITENSYYYDATGYYMAIGYYRVGQKAKGGELAKKLVRNAESDINYILSLKDGTKEDMIDDIQRDMTMINAMAEMATASGDAALGASFKSKYDAYVQRITQSINMSEVKQ